MKKLLCILLLIIVSISIFSQNYVGKSKEDILSKYKFLGIEVNTLDKVWMVSFQGTPLENSNTAGQYFFDGNECIKTVLYKPYSALETVKLDLKKNYQYKGNNIWFIKSPYYGNFEVEIIENEGFFSKVITAIK